MISGCLHKWLTGGLKKAIFVVFYFWPLEAIFDFVLIFGIVLQLFWSRLISNINNTSNRQSIQPVQKGQFQQLWAKIRYNENPPNGDWKSPKQNSKTLSLINTVEVKDVPLLDEQINSMTEKGKNRVLNRKQNGKDQYACTIVCKVCGKEGKKNVIKANIEAKHVTGITHTCEICGNIEKTKNSLRVHKSLYHKKEIH